MTIMSEYNVRKSLKRSERENEVQTTSENVRQSAQVVRNRHIGGTHSLETSQTSLESTDSYDKLVSEQLDRIQQLRVADVLVSTRTSVPFNSHKGSIAPIACKSRLSAAIERLSSYNDLSIQNTIDRWRCQLHPPPDPHLTTTGDIDAISLISPTYPEVTHRWSTPRESSFSPSLYQQSRNFNSSYHGITGSQIQGKSNGTYLDALLSSE